MFGYAERMQTFLAATTWEREGAERVAVVDDGWAQGRGAYGGVVAAGILRAMIEDVGDAVRRPRSLTVHFCAPLGPRARLRTAIERAGARVTHLSGRLYDDAGVVAIASASFAAPRPDASTWSTARIPEAIPFADAAVVDNELMPAFTRNFEYRFAIGELPYSGAAHARVGGWVRLRAPGTHDVPIGVAVDAPYVAAVLDAFPPAALSRVDGVRSAASVDLTVHFYGGGAATTASPLLVDVVSAVAEDGYAEERAWVWTQDGALLGECRQIVAIL